VIALSIDCPLTSVAAGPLSMSSIRPARRSVVPASLPPHPTQAASSPPRSSFGSIHAASQARQMRRLWTVAAPSAG